ncbi:zinc ribbon domain-containing protein [Kallotenue papyrolyticum]|uniref:zinc ribbon domain-containing protein n=1 Tax=Kallotenue papyrolyticum TaxID=1325125 RepID=UPI00047852CB|nr:zinc ribbon domain-containing protein [Kallotenue papyrolyticum]
MGFLDQLSKTLTSGVERAKFEAEKFQRTSRISGEISNIKSQVETNLRQLGERALELYQQGVITAPEIASLAQIITQLREQLALKESELTAVQNETFEAWQASQPQSSASTTPASAEQAPSAAPAWRSRTYDVPSPTGAVPGEPTPSTASAVAGASDTTPTRACPACGYRVPENAVFCPNCGSRVAQA